MLRCTRHRTGNAKLPMGGGGLSSVAAEFHGCRLWRECPPVAGSGTLWNV
ncbi:hypothetical protein [Azospirillum doebereinerae]